MLVRNDSTGAPSLRWYLPAASAAAVRNAVFNLPPSTRDASIISRYGARNVSVCRCSERCVHNGERAGSTVLSSETSPRTVAAACVPRPGSCAGSCKSSRTWRSALSGARITSWNEDVSKSDGLLDDSTGSRNSDGSSGGGGSALRSRSRNCIDNATPPWPSVMVWCSF